MKRLFKLAVVGFVALGVLILASAVAGGLLDDRAFTPAVNAPS